MFATVIENKYSIRSVPSTINQKKTFPTFSAPKPRAHHQTPSSLSSSSSLSLLPLQTHQPTTNIMQMAYNFGSFGVCVCLCATPYTEWIGAKHIFRKSLSFLGNAWKHTHLLNNNINITTTLSVGRSCFGYRMRACTMKWRRIWLRNY